MICRYKIKFISDIEQKIRKLLVNIAVAPFVGVWIEISLISLSMPSLAVAPFVGVWIEICRDDAGYFYVTVAPFVGVWIEIILRHNPTNSPLVDPFARMQIQLYFTWCGLY